MDSSGIAQGSSMADAAESSKIGPVTRIGSYRLVEPLGSGGMSSVYRAVHEQTGHEVAIKVLPRTLAKHATLLQRFIREARSAEALEHPNIVSIFDRGADDGRHYLVLELVPGGDLHDRVRNQGPLEIAQSVAVIKAVAEALSHAAGRGLIHRDIKPANILMTPAGLVKLTDLGLALSQEDEDERVTRDGTTVGTVDYMSPEQARDSRATSVRSDMYSLGCTLFFLLSGQPPFAGGNVLDKLKRHNSEPPPDIRKFRPEVPESLARLTQRMMAKKPDGRFSDYDQLIAALDSLPLTGAEDEPQLVPLDEEEPDRSLSRKPGSSNIAGGPGRSAGDRSGKSTPHNPPATPAKPEEARGSSRRPTADAKADPSASSISAPLLRKILEEDEEAAMGQPEYFGPASFRRKELSLQQYIVRGLLIGLVIVVICFGLPWLFALMKSLRSHASPSVPAPAGSREPAPGGDSGGQGGESDRTLAPAEGDESNKAGSIPLVPGEEVGPP